jgi:predicted ArsR family transcriptional regulator
MKATSLEANRKAEIFKTSHKRKILAVLDGKMNTKDIAKASGLEYHAVARRMKELVTTDQVLELDPLNGFTMYEKTN